MDILKAFKLINDKNIEVNIKGPPEEPLFNAKQIGNILEIKNISDSLKNYDNSEKLLDKAYTKKVLKMHYI